MATYEEKWQLLHKVFVESISITVAAKDLNIKQHTAFSMVRRHRQHGVLHTSHGRPGYLGSNSIRVITTEIQEQVLQTRAEVK